MDNTAILDSVRDGLLFAFVVLIPVVISAVAASILIGGLGARIGARDPQLAAIARAVAVVISLLVIGGAISGGLVDFCRELWGATLVGAGGG